MLVYEGIKSGFINDVNLNLIVNKIYEKYQKYFGRTSDSQLNSWKNSMQYMRGVLDDNEIPDNAGVAIEFNIPTTSKRIDFILSGRDRNKKDSVIIIELKQWEKCDAVEGKDGIVSTFTGHAIREVTHPSYQAMSYANLIKDFNEELYHSQDDTGMKPMPDTYLEENYIKEKSKEFFDVELTASDLSSVNKIDESFYNTEMMPDGGLPMFYPVLNKIVYDETRFI